MANIFYISSWGGSATAWLARSLDLHPNITCFHGGRHWPLVSATQDTKDHSGVEAIPRSPEEFAVDLAGCGGEGHFAGGIHGYHRLSMLDATAAHGGRFAMIARDPIMRINSLVTHHLQTAREACGDDCMEIATFYFRYAEQERKAMDVMIEGKIMPGLDGVQSIPTFVEDMTFFWVVLETFRSDAFQLALDSNQIFRMEDFTSKPEVFRTMFRYLTQEKLPCTDDYLDRVFSQGKINVHRKSGSPRNVEDMFSSWTKKQKMIFLYCLDTVPDAVRASNMCGYPFLQQIVKWASSEEVGDNCGE